VGELRVNQGKQPGDLRRLDRRVGAQPRCSSAPRTARDDASRFSAHAAAADFAQWTPRSWKRQIRHAVRTISAACSAWSVSDCQTASSASS
jgi:hypothetical protein